MSTGCTGAQLALAASALAGTAEAPALATGLKGSRRTPNCGAARPLTAEPRAPHKPRLWCTCRHIEDMYSKAERQKDPWDTTVHPTYLRRGTNAYQEMLKVGQCSAGVSVAQQEGAAQRAVGGRARMSWGRSGCTRQPRSPDECAIRTERHLADFHSCQN
jgi:hypothetical protein